MSKVVGGLKDIGVPVPTVGLDPSMALVCYYGPAGFVPDYGQAARIAVPTASLSQQTVNGQSYWDFPVGQLLPADVTGAVDFYFTLMTSAGSEGDFSPVISETVDRTVPPTLGAPILLG